MKKTKTETLIPKQDKRICTTICICQMCLVFSCVAIVYLSVAVYMPTLRAYRLEIDDPVMCTTIRVDEGSNHSSCSEWCLSKGSGGSKNRQIYVHLRENGSEIIFDECINHDIYSCQPINFESMDRRLIRNCRTKTIAKYDENTKKNKLLKTNECSDLTGLFHCFDGVCYDVSDKLDCNSHNETLMRLTCGQTQQSKIKGERVKNLINYECGEIHGVFNCEHGNCSKTDYSNCGHDCGVINIDSKNVVIMSDDQVLVMKCSTAKVKKNDSKTELIWNSEDDDNDFLMVSCLSYNMTNFNVREYRGIRKSIEAIDCIEGVSLNYDYHLNATSLNATMNYMNLSQFYNNLTKNISISPFVSNLTINKETKLMINLEGCVNTLRDECKEFYKLYSSNGSDHNAVSRFNCYYSKHDNSTAFLHFNLETETRNFIFAFFIPSIVLVISCFILVLSQKIIIVGDDSKMRFKCFVTEESGKLNVEPNY